MSYEKQTWQTGDVVTSAKLNHMEDGIAAASSGGGGALVVNVTTVSDDNEVCDKTAGEMFAAIESGGVLLKRYIEATGDCFYSTVTSAGFMLGRYSFTTAANNTFEAISASDYPATSGGRDPA